MITKYVPTSRGLMLKEHHGMLTMRIVDMERWRWIYLDVIPLTLFQGAG